MYDASKYAPLLDKNERVAETVAEYVSRLHPILPNFPEKVLIEWLYRHWNQIEDHAFLNFETLYFERQMWKLEDIPGREAFRTQGSFFDNFDYRLASKHRDWLAHYMNDNGTWN